MSFLFLQNFDSLQSRVQDHESVRERAPVRGMRQSLFFWDHDHVEGGATDESRSKYNDEEARMAVRLAKHLLLQVAPLPINNTGPAGAVLSC